MRDKEKAQKHILNLFKKEISAIFPLLVLKLEDSKLTLFFDSGRISITDIYWDKSLSDILAYQNMKYFLKYDYVGEGRKFKNIEEMNRFFENHPKKEAILRSVESYIREEELSPSLMGEYYALNNKNKVLEAYEQINPIAFAFNRELDAIRKMSTREFLNNKVSPEIRRFLNKKFNFEIREPSLRLKGGYATDYGMAASDAPRIKKEAWELFLKYLIGNHLDSNGFFKNISKTIAEYGVMNKSHLFTFFPNFTNPKYDVDKWHINYKKEGYSKGFTLYKRDQKNPKKFSITSWKFIMCEDYGVKFANIPHGREMLEDPSPEEKKQQYAWTTRYSEPTLMYYRTTGIYNEEGENINIRLSGNYSAFSPLMVQDLHHEARFIPEINKYMPYVVAPSKSRPACGNDFKILDLISKREYTEAYKNAFKIAAISDRLIKTYNYINSATVDRFVSVYEARKIIKEDLEQYILENMAEEDEVMDFLETYMITDKKREM